MQIRNQLLSKSDTLLSMSVINNGHLHAPTAVQFPATMYQKHDRPTMGLYQWTSMPTMNCLLSYTQPISGRCRFPVFWLVFAKLKIEKYG